MTAMTDEDHLRDLLRQAGEQAGPPSSRLTDREGYRTMAARRRLHRVALVAAATGLAIAAMTPVLLAGSSSTARVVAQPTSTSTPVSSTSPSTTECAGSVLLTSSGGQVLSLNRSSSRQQLTVHIGDVLTVQADGPCGADVSATPQTSGILTPSAYWSRTFTAVAPGSVLLVFYHPMCAEHPDPACRGGIAGDGEATIRVTNP
jgi:hypothetical protein